uniref:Uncharacterized protein n=1 Tax=Anguilla anguilla TaxID=7936 RepID=A0A0E9V5Y5_ANGAN
MGLNCVTIAIEHFFFVHHTIILAIDISKITKMKLTG